MSSSERFGIASGASESDERTPLLHQPEDDGSSGISEESSISETYTPLPKLQLGVCLLIQFAEPITALCIFPFINQLISELDITHGDKKRVGYYVGIIDSLFFAVEAITVLQWSRLSDHIGRKPVLMIGLFGLTISMICFGLSRTFWTLVISRCLAGALNGNIGVMKSVTAELTDETNIAQAVSLMPVVYATGSTIATFMGGVLSRPNDRFPTVFAGDFWKDYPYFLPCGVAAAFSALSCVATAILLKETLPKDKRALPPSSHPTVQNSPTTRHRHTPNIDPDTAVSLRDLIHNRAVMISATNYGFLALLDEALFALIPLFYSTPVALGGLGFPPSTIGYCIGAFGLVNGLFQAVSFRTIVERFGSRAVFRLSMSVFVLIFGLFPVMSWLVRRETGMSWDVWAVVGLQLCLLVIMDMGYGCIFIFVTEASPTPQSLGATNGLSQTVASIVRTIGPTLTTSLFAVSIERNLVGGNAVYILMIALSLASIWLAGRLPDEVSLRSKEDWSRSVEGMD